MSEENPVRRVWLVRHGVTQWNSEQRFCGHSDISLTSEGRRQALWLAKQLSTEHIAAIYSSDLSRARQTAEIIAAPHATPIRVEVAWRELSFGDWEGLTYAQIAQRYPGRLDFFSDPLSFAPPNGESLTDLSQRVQPAFARLVQEREKGTIVLVSHGGPLRALLCSLLTMPLERQWQLHLDPGSLSALDISPSQDGTAPIATLALLNQQRPRRPRRVPIRDEALQSSVEQHKEGSLYYV